MKRIEISLVAGVVAPLLDFIKPVLKTLETETAFGPDMAQADRDLEGLWREGLIQTQIADCRRFLGLFGADFCNSGKIEIAEEDADPVLRAAAAVRLKLRGSVLRNLSDAALAEEKIDLAALAEDERRGFGAYIFLATLQEIVIKHLGGV
jgi:hypothetical protein